jgi:hypothetical protein
LSRRDQSNPQRLALALLLKNKLKRKAVPSAELTKFRWPVHRADQQDDKERGRQAGTDQDNESQKVVDNLRPVVPARPCGRDVARRLRPAQLRFVGFDVRGIENDDIDRPAERPSEAIADWRHADLIGFTESARFQAAAAVDIRRKVNGHFADRPEVAVRERSDISRSAPDFEDDGHRRKSVSECDNAVTEEECV